MTEPPGKEEGTRASDDTGWPIYCALLVMAVACAVVCWLLGWGFWLPLLVMPISGPPADQAASSTEHRRDENHSSKAAPGMAVSGTEAHRNTGSGTGRESLLGPVAQTIQNAGERGDEVFSWRGRQEGWQ